MIKKEDEKFRKMSNKLPAAFMNILCSRVQKYFDKNSISLNIKLNQQMF